LYAVGDDHQSSLDAQSVNEDHPLTPQKEETSSSKAKDSVPTNRRASVAASRPVVTSTSATIPPPPLPNGVPKTPAAKPATELKYASAVAAATNPASLLGLGPLPPPSAPAAPHRQASVSSVGSSIGNPARTTSPVMLTSTVATQPPIPPASRDKATATNESPKSAVSPTPASSTVVSLTQEGDNLVTTPSEITSVNTTLMNDDALASVSQPSFDMNGTDDTDIATLPPGLRDLLRSFQSARSRAQASSVSSAPISTTGKMLEASRLGAPDALDSETRKRYVPQTPYPTPPYYPQVPHPTVVDPSFVRRCDVDTLFFMFYYQQETIQQYSPS